LLTVSPLVCVDANEAKERIKKAIEKEFCHAVVVIPTISEIKPKENERQTTAAD
jgi:ribosomal protein L23